MPSRAYASFLHLQRFMTNGCKYATCQCPLGLIPHFYDELESKEIEFLLEVSMPSRAYAPFLQGQRYQGRKWKVHVSMPSRAYAPFLRKYWYSVQKVFRQVSMPSRASTSFLQYPFKNLGFMRFPEPVFAGICQNILTVTVFRAC